MKNYVIIGGGIASLGCIDGIRSKDSDGKITMICGESHPPYARPLISYYLENKTSVDKMQYRNESFYKEKNVNIILNTDAIKIENKEVVCNDGKKYKYDKLLAATGSSPFVPPMKGLDGVGKKFTFMTIDETLKLEECLFDDARVLIVGAGLIGLKCAEGIKDKVKQVVVCDLADNVLSSILDRDCAKIVQDKLENNGIEFMLSDSVEEFTENKAVMKSGKVVGFDILVLAVGVRPNTALLKDVGAEVNRGVIVDDKMQTTVAGVYAAGDIAESTDITSDTTKIMAILPNAYMGGYCAGVNMAGGEERFDNQIPMNSIGFFGYHIMTAGSYDGEMYEEACGDCVKRLYVRANRLIGFIMLGNVDKAGIYTYLIRNKTPLDTIDYDKIKKNPSLLAFSLKYRRKNLGGVL